MKIVINRQHGGFGLSPKATRLWAERKGKKCYFFTLGLTSVRITEEEATSKCIGFCAFSTPKPPKSPPASRWGQMTLKEKQRSNARYRAKAIQPRDADRNDSDLVAVVEELGEAANGRFAKLRVIEIPDGVEWQIEEYDGLEWIAEKHRTWGDNQ